MQEHVGHEQEPTLGALPARPDAGNEEVTQTYKPIYAQQALGISQGFISFS
jgi:hypothetical protein